MKRLLALDGGGIRGIFTLEVLARMEALLRAKTGRPALVLADYFDYIAGTSTGGIIATCLSWGMPVAEIEDLYIRRGMDIFRPAPWYKRWRSKYAAEAITAMLKEVFAEDAAGQVPALLGTRKLRTLLCLVMRNYSTGSPWPISNNPAAKFNDPASPECNLRIPLWQLVRASTAAPTFFPPETIVLGGRQHVFVDGGITPYNNPSLLLYLMATMPCFHLEWERGLDKLLLVSIGTGRVRVTSGTATAGEMSLLFHARRVPVALIDSSSLQQDLLCRILGQCRVGDEIDCEIGDLKDGGAGANPGLVPDQASGEASGQGSGKASGNNFTYLRYNLLFTPEQHARAQQFASTGFAIDNLKLIPLLRDLGAAYAAETVRAEDLP